MPLKIMDKITFVNIVKGQLCIKLKDQEPSFFSSIEGVIIGIKFKKETFKDKEYEKIEILFFDGIEKYIVSIRVDSGYFRGFMNSFKTANINKGIILIPSYKIKDGKPSTTCFIEQDGKILKHAYSKKNLGDLPPLERVNDTNIYNSSNQIAFWKIWVSNLKFDDPFSTLQAVLLESDYHKPDSKILDDDLPF